MRTLVVKYLPSGKASNTKILLDYFKNNIKGDIQELDLLSERPPIFTPESLEAYDLRDYLGEKLDSNLENKIKPFDEIINKFVNNDIVVIACPFYNFSYPGEMKNFFDAILLLGQTFTQHVENGITKYKGLMEGKKILTIYTAAGNVKEGSPHYHLNFLEPLGKTMYELMGFSEMKFVTAAVRIRFMSPEGKNEELTKKSIASACEELKEIAMKWYA
ncbi:MAG: NAD(P)H-dependent oxidoreductase [Sphingobacteriia bacterium]|nr:NAD(P)H-dependent oxidoreductase [Sphingobacteriia bacterium]